MAKKKKIELFTKEQEKKLQELTNELLNIAAHVVEEYEELDLSELSELSGSITQINENSPFLDEVFEGDSWKKVIKNIPPISTDVIEDNEDDTEWINKRNSKESNDFNSTKTLQSRKC